LIQAATANPAGPVGDGRSAVGGAKGRAPVVALAAGAVATG